MKINLFILTLCAIFSIAQTNLSAQNSGVKGLNDYAKTHALNTEGGRAEIKFGYLPWEDGSWTDLNGNQIPASAIYDNIDPIGCGLFLVSSTLVVDESGEKIFSGSDISAKVYSNLLLLNNSRSDNEMYGLMTTDGKEIVPYEAMTKDQLNEKIGIYMDENPNDSLNVSLQMYLHYPNSQVIRLGERYYLYSFDKSGIIDVTTGQNVLENVNGEGALLKIKELSGLFHNLQVTDDIKQTVDSDIKKLRVSTWGDGLFLIGEYIIADSTGKAFPFRKEDVLRDGKKRPNEYSLKGAIPCGSKIWYRCFNSTHQAILDYQDKIICSWPRKQGPDYVTILTDKLFCMQYSDGKVVFYSENFSTNSTKPLFGETIGWNETSIIPMLQLRNLVRK